MYSWGWLFAPVLSLVCYYSPVGQFLVHGGFCLLCFLVFPLPCKTNSETQTDSSTEKTESQEVSEARLSAAETSKTSHTTDEPDTKLQLKLSHLKQYPEVLSSLRQLFQSTYTQLVLPWYSAPEDRDSQPLHLSLQKEFDLIADKIICKAIKFDVSAASLGCIQILTKHIHDAKQSDGCRAFSSEVKEMAKLRTFCEALVHNLFPQHLWRPQVYYCVLQEILASKVLGLVNLLSDPHTLNSLVVSHLGQEASATALLDSDRESTHSPNENSENIESENIEIEKNKVEEHPLDENKSKKKGKMKPKEKKSKFIEKLRELKNKMNKKERKRMKSNVARTPAVIETDGFSSNEESDVECNSYNQEEEQEMKLKLSYEIWKVGSWKIVVTNVEKMDEDFVFTLKIEENKNPENVWEVKRTLQEVADFYNDYKDVPHLPSILTLVKSAETESIEEDQENAKTTLQCFLQDLVRDETYGHTEHVFEFLCPLYQLLSNEEQVGGMWVLLDGLASFLTPGKDDDEVNSLKGEDKRNESMDTDRTSESIPYCYQPHSDDWMLVTDSGDMPPTNPMQISTSEKQEEECVFEPLVTGETDTVAARAKTVVSDRQSASLNSFDEVSTGYYTTDSVPGPHVGENAGKKESPTQKEPSGSEKPKRKKKESLTKEETKSQPAVQKKNCENSCERLDVNNVIFDLLKEISGNSKILKLIKTAPFLSSLIKKKLTTYLKKVNPSETQMAGYIDYLRQLIWPPVPVPQRPPETTDKKNEIREKALQILCSKFSGYAIFSKANMETTLKIFQSTEENKKLVYSLLEHLQSEFLSENPASDVECKGQHTKS